MLLAVKGVASGCEEIDHDITSGERRFSEWD
jgi:hypothetical protein